MTSPTSDTSAARSVVAPTPQAPAPTSSANDTSGTRPVTRGPRRPGLDVLRGLAIALVLVRHAWPETFQNGGIVGVVVFFALSGYLITGVLVSEMDRRGRVSYWRFYRNRFLRLYPALLAILAVFSVVAFTTNLNKDRPKVLRTVLGAVTYTTNIWNDGVSRALNHLWTLALEEQFYVLWPVILVFALRKRIVPATLVIAAVVLTAACGWVIHLNADNVAGVYGKPTSWAICLLIGSATYLNRERLQRMLTGWRGRSVAVIAFGIVAVLTFLPESKDAPVLYLLGGPLIALCSVAMALQAEKWSRTPVWLEPMRALGLISYAAYLWNYMLVSWLRVDGKFPDSDRWLSVFLTILAATASWWLVEKPFAGYRKRLDARERRRAAALATAAPAG